MKPKVFVTRNLAGDALERVRAVCDVDIFEEEIPPSRQTLISRSEGKDGLLVLLTDRIDAEVMDVAPNLRVISNYAVGVDNIDVAEATRRGIPVGNTPSVLTETTADLAFALLMCGARRIVEGRDLCASGNFRAWSPTMLLGSDIHGAHLGIIGMGRIGRAVARRAKGFSMKVLFCSSDSAGEGEIEGATRVSLDELLARSDFVSLHAPLNNATRHIINQEALSLMKPTSVLINTGRGGLVDQDALVEALESGRIAYAALDVTDPEPLPRGHRLLSLPNCLVVPHLGSASFATRSKMAHMAVDNLLCGLKGERLPNLVNPRLY